MNLYHKNETKTFWIDSSQLNGVAKFKPLSQNIEVDVCIIGAGIAGLTSAYLLMKEGLRVAVLESYEIASGQTGRTSAHLSFALDDRFYSLKDEHGLKGAIKAAKSHQEAVSKIEHIVKSEGIQCNFKRLSGFLIAAKENHQSELKKEHKACHEVGLENVDFVPNPLSTFDTGPCLSFPEQAQFHPLKYIEGLVKALREGGAQIFTHTHVEDIKENSKENSNEMTVTITSSDKYVVTAKHAVVASNSPINNRFNIHTKQSPYRTYILAFKIAKNSLPMALYWDTLDPYHYVRIDDSMPDYDVLIIGGEDHKTGQEEHPEDCFKNLETWSRTHFPVAQDILYSWSGQVLEPVDSLAFLGRNPGDKQIYIITGDSGHGLTHATIGATIITDQILGRENDYEKLYDPSRSVLNSKYEFVKEGINVALQYRDWLKRESVESIESLEAGEGIVVTDGAKKIAAYKSPAGDLELKSAVCTHLGCIVRWNTVEKSWDCPCHGSRFDCQGRVVEGPAKEALAEIEKS